MQSGNIVTQEMINNEVRHKLTKISLYNKQRNNNEEVINSSINNVIFIFYYSEQNTKWKHNTGNSQ